MNVIDLNHFTESFNALAGSSRKPTDLRLNEMKAKLLEICSSLDSLKSRMESEFLAIGSDLLDFNSRTSSIAETSLTVASLLKAEDIVKSAVEFRHILDKVDSYLKRAEGEAEQYIEKMYRVSKTIGSASKPLGELREIAKFLRTLGVSTQIVTAKLSRYDASFLALTDNIKNMSKIIDSRVADITSKIKLLSGQIGDTIETMETLARKQKKLAAIIVENSNKGYKSLLKMTEECSNLAETTRNLSGKSDEISGSINDITVSMQFHDIYHQRVVQVRDEVKDIYHISAENKKTGDTASFSEERNHDLVRFVSTCSHQRSNLDLIKNEMISAVDEIIFNLRGIARNIVSMSTEIGDITKEVRKDFSSFWNEMDFIISSFSTSIKEKADTSGQLNEIMNSVAGTVSETSMFVEDIEEIGADLKLIAFNTRIKAAHLKKKGAEVEILAKKLGELSNKANTHTNDMLEVLQKITSEAQELFEDKGVKSGVGSESLENIVHGLVDAINPLRQIDDKAEVMLEELNLSSSELENAIKKSIAGINVHVFLPDVIRKVTSELGKVERKGRFVALRNMDNAKLDGLLREAGMKRASVVSIEAYKKQSNGQATDPGKSGKDDEIGDNIEFF